MALLPRSPYLSKTQAVCPQRQDPKEACQGAASQVCRMPVWRDDQASLARQGNQGRPQGICCNQTWRVRLGGSNNVNRVGFYAQLKGKLTKKRYKCTTIFVNHFSHLRFIHLQLDNKSDETLIAKFAFEQYAAEHGVKVLHYHCNNRHFHDNAFRQACHDARQQLTFCGVNAHFQNGIAK